MFIVSRPTRTDRRVCLRDCYLLSVYCFKTHPYRQKSMFARLLFVECLLFQDPPVQTEEYVCETVICCVFIVSRPTRTDRRVCLRDCYLLSVYCFKTHPYRQKSMFARLLFVECLLFQDPPVQTEEYVCETVIC